MSATPGAHLNIAAVPRTALTVDEACASLGVSWDTWRTHIEPNVRLVRIGRRKLIPIPEIQRWLTDNAHTTLEHQ